MQRFTARREHGDAGAVAPYGVGECGAGGEEVLAAVEHEQEVAGCQAGDQRSQWVGARAWIQPERGRDGVGDEVRVGHRYQVGDPDSVGVGGEQPASRLLGEPRLARAAHACQGDQPTSFQEAMDVADLPLASDEAGQRGNEVVPQWFPGLLDLDAVGEQVVVDALGLWVRVGAVRRDQIAAQALVKGQGFRSAAHCRMAAHQASDRALVQGVDRQRALQRFERLDLVPGVCLSGCVGEVDEEVAEGVAELLARLGRPVFEAILGEEVAPVGSHRGTEIGEVTGGPSVRRQLLEAPYVDVDHTVGGQRDDVVTQFQQPAGRPVAREHPAGDMQRLMEVVDGRHRSTVRPQRVEEDVTVQPLVTLQCQQFDERARLSQPPRPGIDGLTVVIDAEPTE